MANTWQPSHRGTSMGMRKSLILAKRITQNTHPATVGQKITHTTWKANSILPARNLIIVCFPQELSKLFSVCWSHMSPRSHVHSVWLTPTYCSSLYASPDCPALHTHLLPSSARLSWAPLLNNPTCYPVLSILVTFPHVLLEDKDGLSAPFSVPRTRPLS